MSASSTIPTSGEFGNNGYMLPMAKAFVCEKAQQGLSIDEIIQLAFKNPAFKTIFSTQLQNDIFIAELTQVAMIIHTVITNSILFKLANIEIAALIDKSLTEMEENKKIQMLFSEYCAQITSAINQYDQRKIIELREALRAMDDIIKSYQSRINDLITHVNILNQKKNTLENDRALLLREKFSLLSSAFQSVLSDYYLVKTDDKLENNEYVRVTKTELLHELKEYCITNPSSRMTEVDYANMFHNIVDKKKANGIIEKHDPAEAPKDILNLNEASHSVFEAVAKKIDVDKLNSFCEKIDIKLSEISSADAEIQSAKINIEGLREDLSEITHRRDITAAGIASDVNVDDILKSFMESGSLSNPDKQPEKEKNSDEIDVEHTTFKP